MNFRVGLLSSILFHLILVLAFYWSPKILPPTAFLTPYKTQLPVEKKSIEFIILDDSQTQQVIREAIPPEDQLDKTSKEKAKFLSADTQRVLLETKAKLTGQTANRPNLPKYQQELLERKIKKVETQVEKIKNELNALNEKNNSGYQPMNLLPDQRFGQSTIGEALPENISIGAFTALNTDRFQFYTFYSRVEDLVRFRWESQIKNSIEYFDRFNLLKTLAEKDWKTEIEFLIDAKGNLVKSIIIKESGVNKFDSSAIKAFEEARVFPNPPKEMLRPDGFIHLRYGFVVNFNSSVATK